MAQALEEFTGEACSISDVERELARLRDEASGAGEAPHLRTSVMTHIAWAPEPWTKRAEDTLAALREQHPSRTILLVPDAGAGDDRIDAKVALTCYRVPGVDREVCAEVIELYLRGRRAHVPASVVTPLLISDLPVFCRWRGQPDFASAEWEQLVDVVDRLIVDSTEWEDVPRAYGPYAEVFPRVAASDIAWARTGRWRTLLASLWPEIAEVRTIRVRGTRAQAHLLGGWLTSRLGHRVAVEHDEAERLEGIDLDGKPAPFPPGDPPAPGELLSDELDRFGRDRVYEAAVVAASTA